MSDFHIQSKAVPAGYGVGRIVGGTAFVILPAAVLSVPFAAPLLVVAAVSALAMQRVATGRWPAPPCTLVILLALLICYGAFSSLWSVSVRLSLTLAAQLLGLFAAGLVLCDAAHRLDDEARAFVERAFLAGFALGLAFLTYEDLSRAAIDVYLRNLPVVHAILGAERPIYMESHFNRTATLVGLLVWPAVMLADRRGGGWLAFLVAVVALVPVLLGHSVTAQAAYIVGIIVYFAARRWQRFAPAIVAAFLVLDLVLAPVMMHSRTLALIERLLPAHKVGSLSQRLDIWDFAIDRIGDRPFFGWGLNSSRDLPGGHVLVGQNAELMPLHPHDMALQVRLELGIPGLLLAIAIMVVLVSAAARVEGTVPERASARAACLALIAAAATNSLTGYDLWHPWWLSFLWLSAATLNAVERGPPA